VDRKLAVVLAIVLLLVAIYSQFPLRYWLTVRSVGTVIDPLLVQSIIKSESNFEPEAVSSAGAVGLMQIMPSTAEWLCQMLGVEKDIYHPEDNIYLGIKYLEYLLKMYDGDLLKSLMAYNVGPAGLETESGRNSGRRYLKRVMNYYALYRIAYFWIHAFE